MNKLFILTGKTASGKDTILSHLLEYIQQNKLPIKKLQSNTTRPKRDNEIEGNEYHFTTKEEFGRMYRQDLIAEYAKFNIEAINDTWFYFTTMQDLTMLNDYNCVSIKNPIGCIQLKQQLKSNMVTIMINCDTNIRQQRYNNRGATTDRFSDRDKRDIEQFSHFKTDYIVNNNGNRTIDQIIEDILNIIKKESE